MSTIHLPIHNIVIKDNVITSDLTIGLIGDHDDYEMKVAMDVIESIILAHHCAGIDVTTDEYVAGIQSTIDACENQY